MKPIAKLWTTYRPDRAQQIFALRLTLAALLSLGVAQFLHLPMPLWAVLTAIIVTEMSVGRALKATVDYLAGTLGGAVYGALISALVPHVNESGLLAVLAIAVVPLALITAIKPSLKVAPITAVIVILVPTITHTSPLESAFDRVLEVMLGTGVSVVVTFLILPYNAHRLALEAAARTCDQIGHAFGALLAGLHQGLDMDTLHRLQDGIGQALGQLGTIGVEAERERSTRLSSAEPQTGPLVRTLLRLRHDLVMIGRVTLVPLPPALSIRLQAPLEAIATTANAYLHASGESLLARRPPPALDAVTAALAAYTVEVAALHADGLTRGLAIEGAERFFALGFALEQIHQNLRDLGERVREWAEIPRRRGIPPVL